MSEPPSGLAPLSKEDLKKLKKLAEREKRTEWAKKAEIGPTFNAPRAHSSVSFDAPVKVSGGEDNDKLSAVLGDYRNVATHIMRGTNHLMGVERQPATPAPSNNRDNNFDSRNRQSAHRLKTTNVNSGAGSANRPFSDDKPSSLGSSKVNRTDPPQPSSSSNGKQKTKDGTSQKMPKPEVASQSVKKEFVAPSEPTKHLPVSHREPVLLSINQELMNQSKSEPSKPNSSLKHSDNKVLDNSSGKIDSVLKEKEVENRNNNTPRNKNRPRISIPENVEDMLQEFSGVPQPLTEIKTPMKDIKDIKFPPFQDKSASEPKDRGGSGEMSRRNVMSQPPTKTVTEAAEIAEIQSASSESSSGEEDSDDDSSDDDDDHKDQHEEEKHPVKEETESKVSVNQPAGPVPVNRTAPAPEKTAQGMKTSHYASSDSSSSESGESSDSGSDSESGNEQDHGSNNSTTCYDEDAENHTTPVSTSWGLRSFLPNLPKEPANAKPPSYEAPASEQSEDLDEAEKRAADQVISDENPPSNEFSPPAPIDKHPVLSPIKSPQPVKSPAKRSYPRKSTTDKVTPSLTTNIESINKFGNAYDYIKSRDRKFSQSKASPALSDCDGSKSRRGRVRKTKQKKSQAYVTPDSESESDEENRSHSSGSMHSLHKILGPQKSLHPSPIPGNTVCSPKSLTSAARRKEGKEKLIREKDSIKLKAESSLVVPDKLSDCDNNKAASKVPHLSSAESLPVDEMLGSFTVAGKNPLSPIPNLPHIDKCQSEENLRKAGLAVSTVKPKSKPTPLNGNISFNPKGKPSVMVKLDLNLLCNYLCTDRANPNFLKPLPNKSDYLHQKVTSAKSASPKASKNRKSPKVLNENVQDSSSQMLASKSAPNRTSPFNNSASISSEKSSAKSSSYNKSNKASAKPGAVSVQVKSESGIPDFDSSPVRDLPQKKAHDNSDDSEDSDSGSGSSGSSSSSSDSENEQPDSKAASVSPAHDFGAVPSQHSAGVDNKKRKYGVNRPDDSKRRKTSVPDCPVKDQVSEATHSEPMQLSVGLESNRQSVPVKRERRNSASSQHSTSSNLSQASHSSHKRARSGAVISSAAIGTESSALASSTPHRDLKLLRSSNNPTVTMPSNNNTLSQGKSSSSAAAASSRRNPAHGKFEPPSHTGPVVNGCISPARPPHATGGYSLLEHKHEDERLMASDYYHGQAKKYKHQADEMKKNILTKHFLYLKSALCFLECGLAMEREQYNDASKMYKDTCMFVQHEYHQLQRDTDRNMDTPDKPKLKLAVLCLRVQALVYMKLYVLKKTETVKLKRILDENKTMTTSQPKPPPSAPSPHQANWNRSTGTPSPMSPTPSPANSVCSTGSVGSDQMPSKLSNGTVGAGGGSGGQGHSQRIHSITQKYISNTSYLVTAIAQWDQADELISSDIKDFFISTDYDCGPLTLHSSLQHCIRYTRKAIKWLLES